MITSKMCFKCGIEKPTFEFYKHPRMLDGHLNKCKECTKRDVGLNRRDKLEYYLEYDRNRPNHKQRSEESRIRNRRKYRENITFKEGVLDSKREWITNNPEKRKAQVAANNALRDGKIERKSQCEHCGSSSRLQKHHFSYLPEFWLDVVWLCSICHGKEHKRLNDLGRDPDRASHSDK